MCEIYLNRECMLIFSKKISTVVFCLWILLNYNFNPIFYFLGIIII